MRTWSEVGRGWLMREGASRVACLALAAAALLTPTNVHAQATARITGSVLHVGSAAPVAGVRVSVVGSPLGATTDQYGIYVIDSVRPGLVQVAARAVGFHPIAPKYHAVYPDSTLVLDFSLEPIVIALEGIDVTGNRVREEWEFGSLVLNSERLPPSGNILNALQGVVPGVRVQGRREGTRVFIRGTKYDALYVVDGVVVTPPLTFYIDASEVQCVEVRRGFRAVQEFRRSIRGETYGGVVLIWSKGSREPRPPSCE